MRRTPLALLLVGTACLSLGCKPGSGTIVDGGSGSGSGSGSGGDEGGETGSEDDTGEPTGDDTGEPPAETLDSLTLSPDGLTVNPGASFALRVTGRWSTGEVTEVEAEVLSEDEDIVRISGSTATAVAAGEVDLVASLGELSDVARVTVTEDLTVVVTVVSALDGSPIEGLKVKLADEDDPVLTAADGTAELLAPAGGGGLNVTAYGADHVPSTVFDTVGREVIVPVRTYASLAPVQVSGDVDLSGVDSGDLGDLIVGFVVPTLALGPGILDPESFTAPDRELELYGFETTAPGNFYAAEAAEDYELLQAAGAVRPWTLAGPIPVGELTSGLEDAGDAVELLLAHVDTLSWTWEDGPNVGAGESLEVDLAPSAALDGTLEVEVPELSTGFFGDEEPLVLAGELLVDGAVLPTGLGMGQGTVTVHEVDGGFGEGQVVLALAQVSGLGSGAAACVTAAPRERALPAFPSTPAVVDFVPEDRTFSLSSDIDSTLVRVTLEGGDGGVRDVYLDGGMQSGTLPDPGFTFGYGRTSWSLVALSPEVGTFEERVAGGTLSLSSAAPDTWASCQVSRDF